MSATDSLVDALPREELIAICEAGIVPQDHWYDRDSAGSQAKLGQCWAWLKAGCEFRVHGPQDEQSGLNTTDSTIWLTIWAEGFQFHEIGELREEVFYLPTRAALVKAEGKDWYGVRV